MGTRVTIYGIAYLLRVRDESRGRGACVEIRETVRVSVGVSLSRGASNRHALRVTKSALRARMRARVSA